MKRLKLLGVFFFIIGGILAQQKKTAVKIKTLNGDIVTDKATKNVYNKKVVVYRNIN